MEAARNSSLDTMKGLLTLSMVFAHAIQFLSRSSHVLGLISTLVDLSAFSGFLFCFGFVNWNAYLSLERIPVKKMLKNSAKCFMAFVISGLTYRILVSGYKPSFHLALRIAGLRDIPGYSEFLIAFALIAAAGAAFGKCIKIVTLKLWSFALVSAGCLACAAIPYANENDPIIGLFFGGIRYFYFPVVQYFPLFLLGIYVSRNKLIFSKSIFYLSIFGVVIFIVLTLTGHDPKRFPPSPFWVVFSGCTLPVFLWASNFLDNMKIRLLKIYINSIGQNVLFYLLLSNVFYFTLHAEGDQNSFGLIYTTEAYVCIMVFIFFLQFISFDWTRSKGS